MFQGFLKSLRNKCLLGLSLLGLSTSVFATSGQVLQSSDFVGITFWLISMALVASTAFFFLERDRVAGGSTPTVYRYIDWLITVPLLMIEFYLILSAITKVSTGVFWRLVLGTLVMLVGGYVGEAGYADVMTSFIVGMLGWFYILYEIFAGEASKVSANKAPATVQKAFNTMRLIVTFGWAIYPLGYYFGYLTGSDPASSMASLNIIYNLADVLNKIAFGVIIWSVAVSESK